MNYSIIIAHSTNTGSEDHAVPRPLAATIVCECTYDVPSPSSSSAAAAQPSSKEVETSLYPAFMLAYFTENEFPPFRYMCSPQQPLHPSKSTARQGDDDGGSGGGQSAPEERRKQQHRHQPWEGVPQSRKFS